MEFSRLEYWSGWPFPSPGGLSLLQGIFPTQGWNQDLSHCRWILYRLSHRKPKNTGVGGLSLLQGIILTQDLNQGLLQCRWILYQLSYQGNPNFTQFYLNFVS